MRFEIVQAGYPDMVYIASNMRELDRTEVMPIEFDEDPRVIAHKYFSLSDRRYVARYRDASRSNPVCAWGARQRHPKTWDVWLFATDMFPTVALSVTRQIRAELIPQLFDLGAHRVQAISNRESLAAHKWLSGLGASIEHQDGPCGGLVENFGKGGEGYYRFVWDRAAVEGLVRNRQKTMIEG